MTRRKKKKDLYLVLNTIKDSFQKISLSLKKNNIKTSDDYLNEWESRGAMILELLVIGENIKYIPSEVQEKFNHMAWGELREMRHEVTHDYPGIDFKATWKLVVQSDEFIEKIGEVAKHMNITLEPRIGTSPGRFDL